jgi:hypothetical protein
MMAILDENLRSYTLISAPDPPWSIFGIRITTKLSHPKASAIGAESARMKRNRGNISLFECDPIEFVLSVFSAGVDFKLAQRSFAKN